MAGETRCRDCGAGKLSMAAHGGECDPTAVLAAAVGDAIRWNSMHTPDIAAARVLDVVRRFLADNEWAVVDGTLEVVEL